MFFSACKCQYPEQESWITGLWFEKAFYTGDDKYFLKIDFLDGRF